MTNTAILPRMTSHKLRSTAIVLALSAILGCGSDGASRPSQASASDDPSLSHEQYDQIERLYRSTLGFDALKPTDNPVLVRRETEKVVMACTKVDRHDRLLAAMVDQCKRTMTSSATLFLGDCSTPARCIRLANQAADTVESVVAASRQSQAVIREEVPNTRCQDALLLEEQIDAVAGTAPLMRKLAHAIASGNQAAATDTASELETVSARLTTLPSMRENLLEFRRQCKPHTS